MSSPVFYHAPNTRSATTRILFEELGIPFDLHPINFATGAHSKPEYLAVNPMGKVPAIVQDGELIVETVAIFIYLADRYSLGKLAPALDDNLRGPYLRWLVFYAACMEPAFVDRAMKRDPGSRAMCPYGDWDTLFNTLMAQLEKGPWMLGERYTAADVLWGSSLGFLVSFNLLPDHPAVTAYLERFNARPAVIAARAKDAELAATLAPAAA
jgi:glutathione S-transferase